MFIRPVSSEILAIGKGLLILTIVILVGVSVAEKQLNTLTQRQDCVQVLNVKRDLNSAYSFYAFGESFNIRAIYPVVRILNNDDSIMIEAAGQKVEIPTYINIDSSKAANMYNVWHRQFMDEAFKCKSDFERYAREAARKVHTYFSQDK